MIKKDLVHFFKNVCIYLNIHDWDMRFTTDDYCWKHKNLITINLDYDGDVRQLILHEISHINTAIFSNQRHNTEFWKQLEFLTQKFLKRGLDKKQSFQKEYMTDGHYQLKQKE